MKTKFFFDDFCNAQAKSEIARDKFDTSSFVVNIIDNGVLKFSSDSRKLTFSHLGGYIEFDYELIEKNEDTLSLFGRSQDYNVFVTYVGNDNSLMLKISNFNAITTGIMEYHRIRFIRD